MSKAAKSQKIADRLAKAEGIETRSLSTAATHTPQQVTSTSSLPPMSTLSLPPGLQPTDQSSLPNPGTNTGSVVGNMMNNNFANPNRSVNTLSTVRINSGSTESSETFTLLDSGADTCLAGKDFYIEEETDHMVHVVGFQEHMKSKQMNWNGYYSCGNY
ncbi:MAG: hypothetical protein ACREOZ_01705 [Gloeomargaritales cyanobacterium]